MTAQWYRNGKWAFVYSTDRLYSTRAITAHTDYNSRAITAQTDYNSRATAAQTD